MGLPSSSSGCYDHDPSERLLAGYLHHMDIDKKKIKKRWIVFQGNLETGLYQLKLYRKDAERVLKRSYTITKYNFAGTEKGTLENPKKSKSPTVYWAIILEGETIYFQQRSTSAWIRSEIEEWNNTFKSHFDSVSNIVYPKKGFALMSEDQLSLHLSGQCLSLVSLNPPKCCIKWELSRIYGCRVSENILGFHINSSGSDAGYFEIKCDSNSTCQRIRSSIEGLPYRMNKQESTSSIGVGGSRYPLNKDWSVSSSTSSPTLKARYTPCPTSPLRPRKAPSVEWAPTPPTRFDLYSSSDLPMNRDLSSLQYTDSIHLDIASISSSEASSSILL